MRKIWPSQDNYIQLKDKFASCEFGTPTCEIKAQLAKVILQLANPPGQQLHPDVSHPESPATTSTRMTSGNLLCHTFHPMSYIRNLGAGWERRCFNLSRYSYSDGDFLRHFNFLRQTYPDPRIALTRRVLQPSCSAAGFS